MNIQFKDEWFKFEEPLEMGSKENIASWEFEGDPEQIVHIHPGCGGCTSNCRVEGNKILADYADLDSKRVTPENIKKLYPNKKYPFTKDITVYLQDEEPLHIISQKGQKMLNKNKSKIVLNFGGYVDISPLITEEANASDTE